MNLQRKIELLEAERGCIRRQDKNPCNRKCADCDLVQDSEELLEMYNDLIVTLKFLNGEFRPRRMHND